MHADREALAQALWNLLDNAVKYSGDSRMVRVEVEKAGEVAIRVRDEGFGIEASEQKQIFRKFARGTAARDHGVKGTGIGLAMVKHIVDAHAGRVTVDERARSGKHVHDRPARRRMTMPRILVVEDEPDIALGLEEDLTSHGYEVETVRDGDSAARRGREPGWDLILLDLMLPRKDGYDVCQQLRQAGVRTPVIMLTAKTHEAEKIMGLDLGADDYVTKPFSPRELRSRINAVLRRAAEPAAGSDVSTASATARWISTAARSGGAGLRWTSPRSSSGCSPRSSAPVGGC